MTNIFEKNWLVASELEKAIRYSSGFVSGILLDVGCGDKPYTKYFKNKTTRHFGLDMPDSPLIDATLDVCGLAQQLPIRNQSINALLVSEVLQYVATPHEAMGEFNRVLKTDGIVILTTTQMWHITNAPHDHYRYTEYGLRHLAKQAGFKVLHHATIGSFWMRIGLKFCYFMHRFSKTKLLDGMVKAFLVPFQFFFIFMDNLFYNSKDVINHHMILKKS